VLGESAAEGLALLYIAGGDLERTLGHAEPTHAMCQACGTETDLCDLEAVADLEQAVLIVFADLTRFMVNSRSTPDASLAELLDAYYQRAEGLVSAAGGRVVKFMGDAFLAVWPEARAGDGVEGLPALKRDIDAWWAGKGWDSRVVLKAHFGRAVIGPFGRDARFDVIGNEVNVAATLPARTVSLSAEAFRRLENGKRRAFRKHTAPVMYIPVDDPRP